jgi:hypothetical protein
MVISDELRMPSRAERPVYLENRDLADQLRPAAIAAEWSLKFAGHS